MSALSPFHLAIPVDDLEANRAFYTNTLELEEGRSSDHWVDYNFFGHQLVIHYKPSTGEELHTNAVDGKNVPVPHFGVVLDWDIFETFAERLRSKGIEFIIEPYIRFKGEVGEQATMFFKDPSGNALEFKAFKDQSQLFAK
jgi:extradiol dioxygenase family protein